MTRKSLDERDFAASLPRWIFAVATVLVAAETNALRSAEHDATMISDVPALEALMQRHCGDCHGGGADEGGFAIETAMAKHLEHRREPSDESPMQQLEKALHAIERRVMPPAEDIHADGSLISSLDDADRRDLAKSLHRYVCDRQSIEDSRWRRLSPREVERTIQSVFGLNDFLLPISYPTEVSAGGFDNMTRGLSISEVHVEAWIETADQIAESLFPTSLPDVGPSKQSFAPEDLTISYSSAYLAEDAMRLASSGKNLKRNATWPVSHQAPRSGDYEIILQANAVSADGHDGTLAAQVALHALTTVSGQSRELGQWTLPPSGRMTATVRLRRGETVAVRYANGPLDYEQKSSLPEALRRMFLSDPRLAVAWQRLGTVARGGAGWEQLKSAMDELPENVQPLSESRLDALVRRLGPKNVDTGETIVYRFFEHGPYLGIRSMDIVGPVRCVQDEQVAAGKARGGNFLKKYFAIESPGDPMSDEMLHGGLRRFLAAANRRSVDSPQVEAAALIFRRRQSGPDTDPNAAWIGLIRDTVLSPSFFYRNRGGGRTLDADALANRVGYTFGGSPPDDQDQKLAQLLLASTDQPVADENTRRRAIQTKLLRVMDRTFFRDWAVGWFDLDPVEHLMPDRRVIRNFKATHRRGMREEMVLTLEEIVRDNRPVTDLVDPEFLWTNLAVGRDIYKLDQLDGRQSRRRGRDVSSDAVQVDAPEQPSQRSDGETMYRVSVKPGGPRGGLLTAAATMMATANGVDTQPVLRGVHVLERWLAAAQLEAPDSVPALTPETRGAKTIADRMRMHRTDIQCASCHREMDPLGLALESFDAVGKLRSDMNNPGSKDAGEVMDSGDVVNDVTKVSDVASLKRYLRHHPETLAQSFGEHFITFATGREINQKHRERIRQIVSRHQAQGYPCRDLLVSLVASDLFLAR